MEPAKAKETTQAVLGCLIAQDYSGLLQLAPRSRLSVEKIKNAVADYPYRPIFPAVPIETLMDIVEIKGANPKSWSVNLPLWTKEEGRSDLTLQMHLTDSKGESYAVEIDDLHVL